MQHSSVRHRLAIHASNLIPPAPQVLHLYIITTNHIHIDSHADTCLIFRLTKDQTKGGCG